MHESSGVTRSARPGRLARFFGGAIFLALPTATFAQDVPGGSAMTPIAWILVGILAVSFLILAALALTARGKH